MLVVGIQTALCAAQAACFAGHQQPAEPPAPPLVTRTISVEGKTMVVEMPEQDAIRIDKYVREEQRHASSIDKCQYWRSENPEFEYVKLAEHAWCERAVKDLPPAVQGDGFSISYELANFGDRVGRMGTYKAREDTSDIKIVTLPGATADVKGPGASLYGTLPEGGKLFAVPGGGDYEVSLYWNIDDGNWGKATIWSGTIKLPEQVVATLTVERSLFEQRVGQQGEQGEDRARLAREFCPAGTQLKGDPPPKAELIWCEKSGLKHGPVRAFYGQDKIKAEGSFENDKMEGRWVLWHENGKKQNEGDYHNDKRQGPTVQWYDNGQKEKEGVFEDGARVGTWTEWHPNGQKKSSGEYKSGAKEGQWTTWHLNGKTASKGRYKNDNQVDGTWTYWNERGHKVATPTVGGEVPIALGSVDLRVFEGRGDPPEYFLTGNIEVVVREEVPENTNVFVTVKCWVKGKRVVEDVLRTWRINDMSVGDTRYLKVYPFQNARLPATPDRCEVIVMFGGEFQNSDMKKRPVGTYCLEQSGQSAGPCE